MFSSMTSELLERMHVLERTDTLDRTDGTLQSRRLRQIPPVTGRFLALMAAMSPEGSIVEIGTSAGYSTLWLSLAAQNRDEEVYTFEIDSDKTDRARETFSAAAVEDLIDLRNIDAREGLKDVDRIGFCFMDLDKEFYSDCYDLIIPRLVPGGVLIADNAISHAKKLAPFIHKALNDARVDAHIVPIGKGELICRRASP